MPDVIWPTDLPDCTQNWQEVDKPDTIRTDMETGVAKVRRRSLVDKMEVSVSWVMAAEKYDVFKQFFKTTTQDGILTFNYTHPITGDVGTYRFMEPPTFDFIGGDEGVAAISVQARWERIP